MSEKSFLSASWYRVAGLKPRLRAHARFHRTLFRGQVWYVLQDRTSGRFHRFSPAAYLLVSLLDGTRPLEQVWTMASARLGDDALTQDEVVQLLGQLHAADVLLGGVPPDVAEMAERGRRQRRRRSLAGLLNPLALRLPLLDPEEFLAATAPLARWLFSTAGACGFLLLLAYAGLLAGQHWNALTGNVADRVLATESLLLLLVTYPLVKALHELGHAWAVKRWGGEVHEMGVMLLVFMPVPYVDASDSAAFPSRWHRALVGGAGILVELALASLAMVVWVNAEPSLLRAFAFSVMLICGVSTVAFNGNPLLRFDGYYVLADLLEIPNLGSRANAQLAWLVKRYGFGVPGLEQPAMAPGEAPWLLGYAIASFCYRMVVAVAIALLIGTQFFVIGVIIALWSLVLMAAVPLAKWLRYLFSSPQLRRHRGRALAFSGGAALLVAGLLFLLPLPHSTMAEGVLWVRGDAAVHAGAEGVVARLLAAPNAQVAAATPLLELEDPALSGRARVLAARVAELEAHHAMRDLSDPVRARISLEELTLAREDLALAEERLRHLVVRSVADGQLSLRRPDDLVGRFVRKGELVGYVVRHDNPVVQVVVPEESADLVLQGTRAVTVRTVSNMARVLPARVERIGPGLEEAVPNLALASAGGGRVALDPTDPAHQRTLGKYLQLDLALAEERGDAPRFGERVHVRFSHAAEPVAYRLWRELRQVFLKHFNV